MSIIKYFKKFKEKLIEFIKDEGASSTLEALLWVGFAIFLFILVIAWIIQIWISVQQDIDDFLNGGIPGNETITTFIGLFSRIKILLV